jgi:hypothetical protein
MLKTAQLDNRSKYCVMFALYDLYMFNLELRSVSEVNQSSSFNILYCSWAFNDFALNFNLQILLKLLWSRGQSSWLQIQKSGFDSWHYQIL